MRALLISTYDLGRQPFGLASATAALHAGGVEVRCADLAKEVLADEQVREADWVGFFLPMHTATRLALPVVRRVRALNPGARLCAFGLYAPLNEALLREHGIEHVMGGEFEDALAATMLGREPGAPQPAGDVPRVRFHVPIRASLPPLTKYASVQIGGERRTAGYTEASRGCKHRCRHCPIVPVYDGRFRIVPIPIVLADVGAQVAAGARHITFGDPDFFNGVKHAANLLRAFAAEFPETSYDVTIKVEHLLRNADLLPVLRDTGCLFVTSAVESIDDDVLQKLEKGHTRRDFEEVVRRCRAVGLTLVPTFVAFTPWTTARGYCDLLHAIDAMDLVDHVAPVQLVIRLLIPQGSRLLELPDVKRLAGAYSPESLTYPWRHPDPAVDVLQRRLERLVGVRLNTDRRDVFRQIWMLAHEAAGISVQPPAPLPARATIPYLNEPWYC